MAKRLIFIMCITWLVAGFHLPVFMDIRDGACTLFDFYKLFYSVYQVIFVSFLPPFLMSVFGFLTVRSLHQRHAANTHASQKDRDLMRMLVAEIMINIITSIPFSANLLYGTATFYVVGKSAVRLEIEAFLTFISTLLVHLLSVSTFYLFIISSKTFRREFIEIVVQWWFKYILRRNQIVPFIGQMTATTAQRGETVKTKSKNTLTIV